MSRLGKISVEIPSGVKVNFSASRDLHVEGPKGNLNYTVPSIINLEIEDKEIKTTRNDETATSKATHGLVRTLVFNMVKGVTDGFKKQLEIKGVGYRAQVKGSSINLILGFSHPVDFPLPPTVKATVQKNTTLILESVDKALLGNVAAKIRALRPPEPYKGKGIRYSDEVIKRKAGKSAGAK